MYATATVTVTLQQNWIDTVRCLALRIVPFFLCLFISLLNAHSKCILFFLTYIKHGENNNREGDRSLYFMNHLHVVKRASKEKTSPIEYDACLFLLN